ncbi:MAG: response regulator [Bacteroidetes bacterium]|nr:response regulator [Fibrella sp.]
MPIRTRKKAVYTVLSVDDDEEDQFMLGRIFTAHCPDCRVTFVSNGANLLTYLATAGPLPALILLDLNMPIMNGFETLAALKSQPLYRPIPVVILTTSHEPSDVLRCYDLGANAFQQKPDRYDDLVQLIQATCAYWLQNALIPAAV